MRKIRCNSPILTISSAAVAGQAVTQINLTLRLDQLKLLAGVNLIDCIIPGQLSDIPKFLAEIQQELSPSELSLYTSTSTSPSNEIEN